MRKDVATKNKEKVHLKYPFSFTSWLLFAIFLVFGLNV